MDHDLYKLLKFLRQIITSSPEFSKKSSTYNNLVAMTATMVCNYNQTHGFSQLGQRSHVAEWLSDALSSRRPGFETSAWWT
jgi:hypothetical protein